MVTYPSPVSLPRNLTRRSRLQQVARLQQIRVLVSLIGTRGTATLANFSYNATVAITRGTATTSKAFIYTGTWTGAHPLGSSYAVFDQVQTSTRATYVTLGIITRNVTCSTSLNVWVRTTTVGANASVLVDGHFYVHTVP